MTRWCALLAFVLIANACKDDQRPQRGNDQVILRAWPEHVAGPLVGMYVEVLAPPEHSYVEISVADGAICIAAPPASVTGGGPDAAIADGDAGVTCPRVVRIDLDQGDQIVSAVLRLETSTAVVVVALYDMSGRYLASVFRRLGPPPEPDASIEIDAGSPDGGDEPDASEASMVDAGVSDTSMRD